MTGGKGTCMKDAMDEITRDLRALEESCWRQEVRFSRETMDGLLAEKYLEFGASGRVYNKQETLDMPPVEIGARLPLENFSIRVLASSVMLVTYRSIQSFPDGGQKRALRSSIWTRTNRGWQIVFHQGTLLPNA